MKAEPFSKDRMAIAKVVFEKSLKALWHKTDGKRLLAQSLKAEKLHHEFLLRNNEGRNLCSTNGAHCWHNLALKQAGWLVCSHRAVKLCRLGSAAFWQAT
jgi:hypothetical protein